MVEQDARLPRTILLASILVLDHIRAAHEETRSVVLLQVLPELLGFDHFGSFRGTKVVLLRGTSS